MKEPPEKIGWLRVMELTFLDVADCCTRLFMSSFGISFHVVLGFCMLRSFLEDLFFGLSACDKVAVCTGIFYSSVFFPLWHLFKIKRHSCSSSFPHSLYVIDEANKRSFRKYNYSL